MLTGLLCLIKVRKGNQKEARESTRKLLGDPSRGRVVVAWILTVMMMWWCKLVRLWVCFDIRASVWIDCGE